MFRPLGKSEFGIAHDGQDRDTVRTLRMIIGTNVLVLNKQRDNFLSPSQPLKKDVNKKFRHRTSSKLETLF